MLRLRREGRMTVMLTGESFTRNKDMTYVACKCLTDWQSILLQHLHPRLRHLSTRWACRETLLAFIHRSQLTRNRALTYSPALNNTTAQIRANSRTRCSPSESSIQAKATISPAPGEPV